MMDCCTHGPIWTTDSQRACSVCLSLYSTCEQSLKRTEQSNGQRVCTRLGRLPAQKTQNSCMHQQLRKGILNRAFMAESPPPPHFSLPSGSIVFTCFLLPLHAPPWRRSVAATNNTEDTYRHPRAHPAPYSIMQQRRREPGTCPDAGSFLVGRGCAQPTSPKFIAAALWMRSRCWRRRG